MLTAVRVDALIVKDVHTQAYVTAFAAGQLHLSNNRRSQLGALWTRAPSHITFGG